MKLTILGTGALGIALAKVISETRNFDVVMWTKFEEEKELVEAARENKNLLPGVKINDTIEITTDLSYAMKDSFAVINCLPFAAVKEVAESLKGIYNNQHICSTTKGVDLNTFETTTQIFSKMLNTDKICALSGPSFAIEIAQYKHISFVLAGDNLDTVNVVYDILSSNNIFIEKSSDIIGVQICGAVKNAIAIGSGILHGMNAADSTKASYLTKGMKEMCKIVSSLGGNDDTVYTYAGVGDLILTCMSETSRNFSCGKLLGQGYSLEDAIKKLNGKTVEGIKVIESLNNYMKDKNLNLDIVSKLYDIIFNENDLATLLK